MGLIERALLIKSWADVTSSNSDVDWHSIKIYRARLPLQITPNIFKVKK